MAKLCAPAVAPGLLQRIASVESSYNPFAIGVVGGHLVRQPTTAAEALATTTALKQSGWDFSVGLVQVNQKNFGKYGLTPQAAFDPCTNLRIGSEILADCYRRAGEGLTRTGDALSCYYAGNFTMGYRLGYVAKVQRTNVATGQVVAATSIPVVADTEGRRRKTARASASDAHPTPLFVSTPATPGKAVASDDIPPSAARPTALLF